MPSTASVTGVLHLHASVHLDEVEAVRVIGIDQNSTVPAPT